MPASKRTNRGAAAVGSGVERGTVSGRQVVLADTRSYDHLMAQEKLRQEQEMGTQRLDETQPGGFYLHGDGKTAHDAFGRPLHPETGELLKSDQVEFHPVTGDPIAKGAPMVMPGVSMFGTPAQIDARRESWLKEEERRNAEDDDYNAARGSAPLPGDTDASSPHGSAFEGTAREAADEPSETGTQQANLPGDPPGPPALHQATAGGRKRGGKRASR